MGEGCSWVALRHVMPHASTTVFMHTSTHAGQLNTCTCIHAHVTCMHGSRACGAPMCAQALVKDNSERISRVAISQYN